MSPFDVILVLGGPGAGKGTQCELLNQKFDFRHLSVGDVLRAEMRRPNSEYASIIEDNMRNGRVGPKEITVELLKRAISEDLSKPRTLDRPIFCIDGFPRKLDQAELFENVISKPLAIILIDCPEQKLIDRLCLRATAQGRFDDTADTIGKRISTYHTVTREVVDHYDQLKKVVRVNGMGAIEEVHDRMVGVIEQLLQDTAPKLRTRSIFYSIYDTEPGVRYKRLTVTLLASALVVLTISRALTV